MAKIGKKTAKKTATSPRNGAVIPLGAHAGNTGGKKGRSGRKPLAFVAECDRLADSAVLPKVEAYLAKGRPDDPAWRWCAEYVSRYTKTEPKRVELANAEGAFVVRVIREAAA